MRIVLRDNVPKIAERTREELMSWADIEDMYKSLDNFDYPHKDKLLEFIKYFFLDHIVSKDLLLINF
jgi:hemerythrin